MFKAIDKWFPGYLRSLLNRPAPFAGTRHLIFSVCDHYEPYRDGVDAGTARQTVGDWLAAYPAATDSFRDADGHPPRHTFFYPQEEYDPAILDSLAAFCRRGYGEVEIHLHHRHDTPEGLREKLITFRDLLHDKHGLLGVEEKTSPQRHRDTEKRMFREFQAASTPPEIPETLSGGNPGERGDVEKTRPLLGLISSFKKGFTFFAETVLRFRNKRETLHSLPLSSPCLRASVVKSPSLVRYAFIHGNWSLCNSRPDGDWCGVNEELGILAETGCYADFTFPSAPSPTQPRMVNAIYYAKDTPGQPRGADQGLRVGAIDRAKEENTSPQRHGDTEKRMLREFQAESTPPEIPATLPGGISREGGDVQQTKPLLPLISSFKKGFTIFAKKVLRFRKNRETLSSLFRSSRCLRASVVKSSSFLLIITGPLGLNWARRKWGILPRLENAEITGANPPTPDRIRLWVRQQIGVAGRPDWVFVKVHTHGCVPGNARVLLGESMRQAHEVLQREFNDGQKWQLHYVTAREMHNLVKAAELNLPGPPDQYRDTPIAWLP